MFSLFKKDPLKKLNSKYQKLMEEAKDIQRSGDLRLYAKKIEEAESLVKQMESLKSKS